MARLWDSAWMVVPTEALHTVVCFRVRVNDYGDKDRNRVRVC